MRAGVADIGKFIKSSPKAIAGEGLEESAVALGRSETSIAHYARDNGLNLPDEWSSFIKPKRIIRPQIILSYPYVRKARPEHADILALNALVPHSYPDAMRADICQEMMLAVLEGTVTIDEVKANRTKSAWFLKKFWMANHEQGGRARSFSNSDDDRSYDEVASSIAAQDWHHEQSAERARYVNAVSVRFQPPTQFEDAYESEVKRFRNRLSAAQGTSLNFREAAEVLDEGGYAGAGMEKIHRSHAMVRAEDRYGLRLDRGALNAIAAKIQAGDARVIDAEGGIEGKYLVSYGGRELPVVYNNLSNRVITVLPEWAAHNQSGHSVMMRPERGGKL